MAEWGDSCWLGFWMIHRMIICRLEDNMYFCSMIKRVDSMKKEYCFCCHCF